MSRKNTKIETTCFFCGKTLLLSPSRVKEGRHNFCSNKCFCKNNTKIKVETKCKQCGKTLMLIASRVKEGTPNFCNMECYGKYSSVATAGRGAGTYTKSLKRTYVAIRRKAVGIRKNTFVCQNCGKAYIRWRRVGEEGKQYCSRECAFMSIESDDPFYGQKKLEMRCLVVFKNCEICGELTTFRNNGGRFCDKCKYDKQLKIRRDNYVKVESFLKECVHCGNTFETYYEDKSLCPKCVTRQNHKDARHKRRLLKRESYIEPVSMVYLFDRDGGRCQICGRKLNLKRTVPNYLAPTIDHIIPLSRGGEHSKKNTQLCCFICNSKKGCRGVDGGEQLMLFG